MPMNPLNILSNVVLPDPVGPVASREGRGGDSERGTLLALAHTLSLCLSSTRTHTHKPIDHMTLAKRWCIAPDRAKLTIDNTMQRGVRTCLYPDLSRRFDTNDRMLRYTRLRHILYSDTMFAATKSRRGYKCAQVFATDFGWVRVIPMSTKSDAHDALSLILQRVGAPCAMVVDGSKEQIGRLFAASCSKLTASYDKRSPTPRGNKPLRGQSARSNIPPLNSW